MDDSSGFSTIIFHRNAHMDFVIFSDSVYRFEEEGICLRDNAGNIYLTDISDGPG